ncbi:MULTISPECIES: toxic anion resistance protein [unclassified Marinobacter]|uniref:toxic anion resistance protein n=1 Tax=unclassified Marinobacter TaxID=83889 RepID=UPI00192935A5|nr:MULTISPECIES: toxic anion resistance protein [unclassified Marinobacter]MBL3823841.1 toxic anion resistance protein [Marinobacter sp. MC3]MBL3891997.1 toxic anion resistance protein [Marinobacter sp. MW3]
MSEKELKAAVAQDDRLSELKIKAAEVVQQLVVIGPRELDQRREMVTEVEILGREVEHKLSETSALLKKPIHELAQAAEDGSEVDQRLLALQGKVREVNPNDIDFSMGFLRRMLSKLPFVGTPISRWAAKYQEVSSVIEDIANALRLGMQQLSEDNKSLAVDRDRMRALTYELEDYVAFGELLDAEVVSKIEQEADAEKKKFLEEEILFALRQRIMDLQQRLAVNQQGVQSADLLIGNNKELIRGIKRALDVTVEALSVASTIAMGLARQKKQLDALQATNETASDLLLQTSERLKTQGVAIHKQAASASLDMDKLKQTFANSLAAWEDINSFRREALPSMRQTINELQTLSDSQRELTEQMEQGQAARNRFSKTFSLDSIEHKSS